MTEQNNYGPFDAKYFVESDPLAEMVDADRKDLAERIGKLEGWLDDRKKILDENISRLEDQVCLVDSEMNRVQINPSYDLRPVLDLDRSLLAIDEQKCREKTGAWKDMFLVGKELLELMKQYQRLKRMDKL